MGNRNNNAMKALISQCALTRNHCVESFYYTYIYFEIIHALLKYNVTMFHAAEGSDRGTGTHMKSARVTNTLVLFNALTVHFLNTNC